MLSVEVRNGYKYYGSSSNPTIVLNYLNMNVEEGSIYGLLGASGCGKTTLLSCIVGQRKLISGDIKVFGLKPGSPGSGLPGPLIGYMPQEISLVEEMTVKETIYYFGRICDMDDEKIDERYNLLKNLLELPPANRLVGQCSGGQKRRVSFACALVHEPKILILDEPTVGLDPILREKIWDFLVETTRNSKMTVILTTHYIEEANQANRIGLMRNGILLAEDTPENIIYNLESTSLEEAFLKLSQRQGSEDVVKKITNGESSGISNADLGELNEIPTEIEYVKKHQEQNFTSTNRMKALLTKSWIQFCRQPANLVSVLFPIFILVFYFLAFGLTPKNLRVGIVNDEVTNYEKCFDKSLITVLNHNNNDTCEFNKISCRYINELNSDFAEKVYFKSSEDAYKSAERTEIIGYIHFPYNFSKSMQVIIEDGRHASDSIFDSMQMTVRLDMSNQQLAYFLQRRLLETYQNFIKGVIRSCNISEGLASTPVNFENVLYGSFDDEYQVFVTPGVIMTMIFFVATLMTSGVFIYDRECGIWDRTQIAGISTMEILVAHLIFQTSIIVVQIIETIIFSHYAFGVENQGENITIFLLLVLNGCCGMLFGLLISIFCFDYMLALIVITGAFYPILLFSGVLWPIEGMHQLFRKPVHLFPITIPVEAARNILQKGWPISDSNVYNGFIILIGWIIIFLICCIIGLKWKT